MRTGCCGATLFDGSRVVSFAEKPADNSGYVNGGFIVRDSCVLDRVENDSALWEGKPEGFWRAIDTLRDKAISRVRAKLRRKF